MNPNILVHGCFIFDLIHTRTPLGFVNFNENLRSWKLDLWNSFMGV